MKNYVLSLLLLAGLLSCKTEEKLNLTERFDFSKFDKNDEYTVFEGFARLVPYKEGVVLLLETDNSGKGKSFVLQSETPLLDQEKILGRGKVYYRYNYEKFIWRTQAIYFDGDEQLSLTTYPLDPKLPAPIEIKNVYKGYGLATYHRVVDINTLP
ncbi:MAG: hypothetical protein SFU99_18960 [Saprospiraceae bacterium]|nr:hypothetical protein [Saprospiraceae bacterium]